DNGQVVKSLAGLLVVLYDGGYRDTEIVRWLFTPDPSLTITRDGSNERQANARPVDALHSHQAREVVRRAQAMAC
nr:DNA-binding protein [Actinomycetes bacterium]